LLYIKKSSDRSNRLIKRTDGDFATGGALRKSVNERSDYREQTTELQQVAQRMGCDIVDVYCDHGISGAKGRAKRPAFDGLCKDVAKRKFDIIMAWSVDRLGRSLQDLIGFLSEIHALRIDLYLHQQGLDTTTPAGKAMFQMLGVFAEFERAMIRERVKAGLARARANGKTLGRPRIDAKTEDAIREALRAAGIRKVAAMVGCGVGTVARVRRGGSEFPSS
jgi:DNA invertase Pin-like site-specific DNA recombinase